jgi:two-component system response regulator
VGQEEADILLVQDNPDDLELVLRALGRGGLANHVAVRRGGDQAPNSIVYRGMHARRQPPRLDPLNLKRSEPDGLHGFKQPKNNPANKPISVVILPAPKEKHGLIKGDQWGFRSYIQEPVNFAPVRKTVTRSVLGLLVMNQPPPRVAFQGG